MRKVVIMGAGGRDFHDFNTVFRDDPDATVVAFTAAQIPGIAGRLYPPSLTGPRYPRGIPIRPEHELAAIITADQIDEVVFAYSDLSHEDVMHRASIVLATGADFRLLGPRATMISSSRPVIAVCAVRTGGKSQTSRRVAQILRGAELKVALVRHPMAYGDLHRMRVQRLATLEAVDASSRASKSARSTSCLLEWGSSCTPASTTPRSFAGPRRKPMSSSGTVGTTTSRSSRPTC